LIEVEYRRLRTPRCSFEADRYVVRKLNTGKRAPENPRNIKEAPVSLIAPRRHM
jgi:hypothetical protein